MNWAAVVVTWNGGPLVRPCLDSVLTQEPPPALVVAIDNASTDGTVSEIEAMRAAGELTAARLRLLRNTENLGFTRAANTGLREALCHDALEAVALVNQDATLEPGWAAAVAACLEQHASVAAVGSKIHYPDRCTIQHAGGFLVRPRMVGAHFGQHARDEAGRFDEPRDVDFVTAAACAYRLSAVREVGVFDEIFSPGYYEDVDLCCRLIERGWRVMYWPAARALHEESASFTVPLERLTLSHAHRLVFALPRIMSSDALAEFAASELAFVRSGPPRVELRAIARACLQVMLMLPAAMRERLQREPVVRELNAVLGVLAQARNEALAAMRARGGGESS